MIRLQIAGVMKDNREEIMINSIKVSIILSLFHMSNATSAQTCPKMLTTSSRLANMHSDANADLNFWIWTYLDPRSCRDASAFVQRVIKTLKSRQNICVSLVRGLDLTGIWLIHVRMEMLAGRWSGPYSVIIHQHNIGPVRRSQSDGDYWWQDSISCLSIPTWSATLYCHAWQSEECYRRVERPDHK